MTKAENKLIRRGGLSISKKELTQQIGVDKLTLSGFRIIQMDIDKLRNKENVTLEQEGKSVYLLQDGTGFKWIKIEDNNLFGTLVAGTKTTKAMKQDYSRIDLFVKNERMGNLQNLTISEYKKYIYRVFEYLYQEYGITVDATDTKISYMEINTTFFLEYEFHKYHRVLRLMMYNLPKTYKEIEERKRKNEQAGTLENETFSRGNNSLQIQIYDKKAQLFQTRGIYFAESIMRIELKLKNQAKVKEVFGTNRLDKITDGMINDFYFRQFNKLFVKKYLRWKYDNNVMLENMVQDSKKKNAKHWQQNLIATCRNHEQKGQVPILLDINDLLLLIKDTDKHGHYGRVEKGILAKCEPDDVYLQGDTAKMKEIIEQVKQAYRNHQEHGQQSPIAGEVAWL